MSAMALATTPPMRARSSGVMTGEGFQHLLVAALERAVTLAQVDGFTIAVAEDLEFDVARIAEILLDIDRGVAESRLGLGPACCISVSSSSGRCTPSCRARRRRWPP
jgi:hypothetical protein